MSEDCSVPSRRNLIRPCGPWLRPSPHRAIGTIGRSPSPFREDVVVIPYRLYDAEPVSAGPLLVGDEALVLACVLSRNHDGHARQRAVERMLASSEDWVVPYVVQLVGEYVVEIMATIWGALAADLTGPQPPRRDAYQRFVRANPDFIDALCALA